MRVWDIEQDVGYIAYLEERNRGLPRNFGKYRGYHVARALVLAEERQGKLWLGVALSDNTFFWKEWEGDFTTVKDETLAGHCWTIKQGRTSDWFAAWESEHGGTVRLEFCSSHVGGCVEAVARDGTRALIEDD